jgi:hypothetical protein
MQQVNLYQPILRKQEKVFSAKTLLQGNLLVLTGLLLLYTYTVVQTRGMQAQLTQVQQQRDEQTRQLTELVKQYPPKNRDASLKPRIEKEQASLQHKRRLLAAVGELGLDEESGFSAHLTGLARQDLPQLWLQHIYLHQGKEVALKGSAFEAEQVPIYLQRLANEKAFSGTAFQQVEIARSEEHAGRVDFLLNTQPPEEQP